MFLKKNKALDLFENEMKEALIVEVGTQKILLEEEVVSNFIKTHGSKYSELYIEK